MGQTRTKIIGESEEAEKKSEVSEESSSSKRKRQKKRSYLAKGRIYINANFNNTLLSLTDEKGNVILWSSSGHSGLKNTKKGTPFGGTKAMEVLLDKMKDINIDQLDVFVKGVGPGREAALRVLFSKNYNINSIVDITPIPFGGPTKPKPRRV
ncbi:MAG: 30S ribosomal protein S11 [Patescibacteria group bacterium]|nr:30S ribosomal protein S11 [Patescibacteria group bacterium]